MIEIEKFFCLAVLVQVNNIIKGFSKIASFKSHPFLFPLVNPEKIIKNPQSVFWSFIYFSVFFSVI